MAHTWIITKLTSIQEVKDLLLSATRNDWLYRGQCNRYDNLIPSPDRKPYHSLSRSDKINLERKGIDLYFLFLTTSYFIKSLF